MVEPRLPDEIRLAPLETFDSKAFIDSDPATQRVCDLVLAIGLVFNDLNDFGLLGFLLKSGQPDSSKFYVSPKWGLYCGADLHIFRRRVAILHELSVILSSSEKEMAHPLFQRLLAGLPNPNVAWSDIVNPPGHLANFLVGIRDKVSNHYHYKDSRGAVVLGEGYRKFFGAEGNRPFISYGNNALDSRLYFVDAAVQGLMEMKDWRSIESAFDTHLKNVCLYLSGIILSFLAVRGCPLSRVNS